MKRKIFLIVLMVVSSIALILFTRYWISTQPVRTYSKAVPPDSSASDIPEKNKQIIAFIEASGKDLAPDYESVVCTEYVIKVIDHFNHLTKEEKKSVRIITEDDLDQLLEQQSPIMKGVQTALILNEKGVEVKNANDVRAGDFVQFWNNFSGGVYGHCGIVSGIVPGESITLYSSHPMTNGFGVQKFLWPSSVFFVRLK